MFCNKCGNQVADNAAFCNKCGNKPAKEPNHANQASLPLGEKFPLQMPHSIGTLQWKGVGNPHAILWRCLAI